MREHLAELEEAEKPAEDGDFLTMDIEGVKDGEVVSRSECNDYLYEVGSGTILSEVDEVLNGSSKGMRSNLKLSTQ